MSETPEQYAVLTVVEHRGPNDEDDLYSVVIARNVDAQGMPQGWKQHHVSMSIIGSGLTLEQACALAATTHRKWEADDANADDDESMDALERRGDLPKRTG